MPESVRVQVISAARCALTAGLVALGIILIAAPIAAQTSAAKPAGDAAFAVRIDSVLDLATVIARTLAVSPGVASGEAGLRNARSESRVAEGAFIPSLTASSSALRSDVLSTALPGTSGANSYSAGVSSSVELFTGGRRGADRARSHADLDVAVATDVSQRYQTTLIAERAFYEALRGEDLVAVAEARVARAERGVRYAQDRVRAGTATKSDELRARLEMTSGRQQALAARDTLQAAAFALGRLVGTDGPVGARRPASLDPRPLALSDSEVVRLAINAAPSVQAAEAAARAARAATSSSRAQYYPDVRVIGGYNWATQSAIVGAVRPGWQLALATSFPLFNGFQREDAVTRSESAAEVTRVIALDATRLVRTESARLLSALRFAEQNISLADEAVTAAQEDLRVVTERYRAGIATSLDQLSSELALTQAERGLVSARYGYQITRATLEALVGRTL
ncbi:MAG: outer rane efflux protein [Gemmatimonadetes bacterium]|nr:outer rane efflux protein [Gemmatimonadota bacterium]